MRDVNVVIECVSENEALKKRIFGELDEILQPKAILASNTSSISITRLAAATQRPKQVFLSCSIQTLCVACHN
jgi:3-hydroxybutyryl-CoA dehydrogenase